MILAGVVGGLLLGLLVGGRVSRLLEARFRFALLVLLALAVRVGTQALLSAGVEPVELLRLPLLAGAFLVLAAALWANRGLPGMLLVLIGVLGNLIAIVANGGWMPVWMPALAASGLPPDALSPTWNVALPDAIGAEFLLRAGPLGDILPIPAGPVANVVSPGDLAIALGIGWFLVATMRWGSASDLPGGIDLWRGPRTTAFPPRPVLLGGSAGTGIVGPPAAVGATGGLTAQTTAGAGAGPTAIPSRRPGRIAQVRAHPYLRLAGDGRFSAFWLAQTVSVFGDRLNQVALGVLVIGLSGSLVLSALVFVSAMLPNLLLGPIAGTFVDRWDHKRVLITSDLLRAGLVLLLPVAADVALWLVYPIVFLITTVSLFFRPARAAVVPRIVRPDDLLPANGALWTGETVAEIAGYPVAGVLVAFLGVNVALAFWLDALTYLVSALLLAAIAIPPVVRTAQPRVGGALRTLASELAEGWRFLRDSPPLFQNTLVSTFGQLSVGATLALTPAYVFLLIGSPAPVGGAVPGLADTLGVLEAALGIGNLVGGFAIGAIGGRMGRGRLVIAGFVLMGLATVILGLAGNVPLALAAAFTVGLFNLVWLVPSQTLFGELVPGALMGRVIAIRSSIVFGAMTGAAAVCTLVADVVPAGTIFAALGAVTVLAGLAGALLPAVRDVPAPGTA